MVERTWTMPDGIYTALVTPFRDGQVDQEAWATLVERQVSAGVSGVVPVGCTGEAAALDLAEREWLVRSCVEIAAGRCAVVAGSGTNVTTGSIELTRLAKEWGADAAMLITPYYNKPQQHGLIAHYAAIARAVDIPQILYNVPGRTAVNLMPQTIAALAAEPNIVAVKEASGDLDQVETIIGCCDLKVFSGDDGLNFPIFGLGAHGAISVVSNLLPRSLAGMWRAWRDGEIGKAWWIYRQLDPVVKACFIESNPVPVKAMLAMMGLCDGAPRLPLAPPAAETQATLAAFRDSTLADLLAVETGASR